MWTKGNVEMLINLIKKNRCLWDATDENRKRKSNIGEAHESIAREMRCSVIEVKKKINSLRSQMNAERTKIAKGGTFGTGGSEIYVPKWQFYNSLLFIYEGESINNDGKTNNSKKRKASQSDEDLFFKRSLQTKMAPLSISLQSPPSIPLQSQPSITLQSPKVKTRTKALLNSITALLSEMEAEDESLGIEFSRELRKIFNDFEDLFEERKRDSKRIPEMFVVRQKAEQME